MSTETLDFTGTTGQWTSLALDGNQLPHLIYNDLSATSLNHAFLAPDVTFTVNRRDTVDGVGTGLPWVVIGTIQGSGYFQIYTYDDTSAVQNTLYEYGVIADYGNAIGSMATDTGFASSWTIETIDDNENDVGKYTSMAYDEGSDFHIAYYDETLNDLIYTQYSISGPGITQSVMTQNTVGQYLDIAMSPLDQSKHISHYIQTPGANLGHAWQPATGGGWTLSVADEVGNVGRFSSIAVAAAGVPHIAYYDATDDDLKHAWGTWDSNTSQWVWAAETVDSSGNVGQYTSTAVDQEGSLHIAYFTPANGGILKHAYGIWDSATEQWNWSITVVVDPVAGSAGQYASLGLDSEGQPHIAYYHGGVDSLEHAWKTWNATSEEWEWVTEEVDGSPSVGEHASLAISDDDALHIAYYDNFNTTLKYASGIYDAGLDDWVWTAETIDDPLVRT